jgi:hypothetical protein
MKVSGQLHASLSFTVGESAPCNYRMGGLVGPRTGPDTIAPTGSRTVVVKLIANQYIVWISPTVSVYCMFVLIYLLTFSMERPGVA